MDYRKLADSIKASISETDISNGDKLTVTVEYDAELAEKIGITVSKSEYTVRASGIGQGEETDLFANIEVIFAGISPNAYVVINNNWKDGYISKLQFTADKSNDVKIGDEITIICSASPEDLARHGIVAKQLSVVYKADRLSSYVTSVSQIDMEMLQSMQNEAQKTIHSQTEDKTFRMLYRATGNRDYLYALNEETTANIQLVDKLLLTRKNVSEADTGNYVYLIYSAEVSNADSMETVYFVFEYSEGYVTVDGEFNILHDEPAERYSCSTDYEALYQEKIGAKEDLYNVEVIE